MEKLKKRKTKNLVIRITPNLYIISRLLHVMTVVQLSFFKNYLAKYLEA